MLVIGLAVALLLVSIVSGGTVGNETRESRKVAAPTAPAAIPVAEVATRATEVTGLLRTLEAQLARSPEIETIQKQLPELVGHIDVLLQGTMEILGEQPPLATLQTQRQIWEGLKLHTSRWLRVLTERAVQLRKALDRLQDLQKTWNYTREAAQNSKAPERTMQEIDTVLTALTGAQPPLQAEHSAVLDLQGRVAVESSRCENLMMLITQAQKQAVGGIFVQEGQPIWSAQLWAQAERVTPARLHEIAHNCWEDLRQYFTDPSAGMLLQAGCFLVLSLLLCAARGRVARWEAAGEGISVTATVFAHPYAAALFCTLFLATRPGSPAPQTVQSLLEIVAPLPMIHLIRAGVDPRIVPGLYALATLFAINTVRQTLDGAPLVGQAILVLEMLAGTLLVGWSLVLGDLRAGLTSAKESARLKALRIGAVFILLTFAVALAAGALGFMGLGRLLASQILAGGAMALVFYSYFLVATGAVAFALRVWPLRLLQMVQRHRELLEQRAHRLLVWLAVGGWVIRVLAYMGLLEPALSSGAAILAMNLERGSISISLGDVLIFIVTVWVSRLLSSFLRFILDEDVYPRMRIAPGLSYAVSNLLHYIILALGVIVGMGLMGMDLSRVTVLAGAFGVGIGFGLQSVVNNFVCGLILLFERPIHVGDMIEIGDLLGEVRRIGIRASVVRTRRGADIIVPNAQLVTDKVTNWTLNDKLRRIELQVGVNYGVSPKKVIEVLETVARKTPRVLQVPAPRALLMSYGDSSINFELRAWTDEPIYWRQVRSNLAVAVYDAVIEAGMTFPFPQREVRVIRDHDLEGKGL